MRKIIFSLLVLLTILSIPVIHNGCIPSKPYDDVEILPSERLIKRLEANRRRIRNFEGTGTLQIQSPGFNNSASFRIAVQRPDSIYLTVLGPFGIELAQASVTNHDFIFYDALNNTAYTGKSGNDILQTIFKINLSFNDLMDAFVGSVNLTDKLLELPDEYRVDYDKYVLTYIDSVSNNVTEYKVDIRELAITEFTISDIRRNPYLEGKYSNFNQVASVSLPYNVQIFNRRDNQRVFIEYRRMEANKLEVSTSFRLPHDTKIIKW